MRLYLDTNVLFFMLRHIEERNMDAATRDMVYDCANQLHTSVLCVAELMQLAQVRQEKQRKGKHRLGSSILKWLAEHDISVELLTEKHIQVLQDLPLFEGHHDAVDRLMIAQAISDKATLVTSDKKFPLYEKHGLKLHLNKR